MPPLQAAGLAHTPGPGALATPEPSTASKRSKASTACNACKLRRGKCSQGRPSCAYCEESSLECVYDRTADKRRNRPRKASHRADQPSLLDALLQTMRHGSPVAIDRMHSLVRDTALDAEDLTTHMQELLQTTLRRTDSPVSSHADTLPASTSRTMNVSYLTSTSPIAVNARPWTRVAEDSMVSHLISIFMTWEQPCFPLIDRATLLSDLLAASPASAKYCSPLLVNAICARACVSLCALAVQRQSNASAAQYLSDDVAKYDRASRRPPLADLFFEEARRHLEAEAWRPSIPSIAALYLMYVRESHECRDRPAAIYRLAALEMYDHLGLGRLVPDEQGFLEDATSRLNWRLAFAASWGCFVVECTIGFYFGRVPPIRLPYGGKFLTEQRLAEDLEDAYLWIPYPLQNRPQTPAMVPQALFSAATLAHIIYDVHAYNVRQDLTTSTAADILHRRSLHERLEVWEQNLHPEFRAYATTLPHVFHFRYLYHQSLIAIVRPLTETELMLAEWGSPRAMEALYCRQLVDEFWALRENVGVRHLSGFVLCFLCSNLTSLLWYLDADSTATPSAPGSTIPAAQQAALAAANSRAFYRASLVCHEVADHFAICKLLLRIVASLAAEHGISIPREARAFYPPPSPPLSSAALAALDVPVNFRIAVPAPLGLASSPSPSSVLASASSSAAAAAADDDAAAQERDAEAARVPRHLRPATYESIGNLLRRAKQPRA